MTPNSGKANKPELPDQDVPEQITDMGRHLDHADRRRLDWILIGITLVAAWTLLLPWTYSRRLGLQVWRLGIEQYPILGIAWLIGLAAAIATWYLRNRWVSLGVAATSALVFTSFAWQENGLPGGVDSWTGPGPSAALTVGLLWILACAARLLAERHRPDRQPEPAELQQAATRLRRTRTERPLDLPSAVTHPDE